MEALAFVKTDPALETPDVEFLVASGRPQDARTWVPGLQKPPAEMIGLRLVLLRPRSAGTVTLRSNDPQVAVRIAFDFLSDPADLPVLRNACRLGREIAMQDPLESFRGPQVTPGSAVASDDAIDAWIRSTAITVNHPSCTCPMGTGADAVLNPDLTVRGVEALRVVDASAFPDILCAHINAATMMLAERASDLIRGRPPLAPANV
jgi:choline dehydrogenase-like flavoprotein